MSRCIDIIKLLRLLEQESDADNILTIKQIITKLSTGGTSKSMDRRRVYSLIKDLEDLGYDISTYKDNGKGYYLNERTFEDCEIQLLIDSLLTSKSIPADQRKALVKKLNAFTSKSFKSSLASIPLLTENFPQNPVLFLNIELVHEAIATRRKIELSSCNFAIDKKLYPNYSGRRFIVSPYKMLVQNQKYYLICKYDGYDGLTHIRLDRMMNLSIVPNSRVEPLVQSLSNYLDEHPYMYSGKNITAILKINKSIIGDVLETFGINVQFSAEDEDTAQVTLRANRRALCYWAIQYGTNCEVLSPKDLRGEIANIIKSISNKYSV